MILRVQDITIVGDISTRNVVWRKRDGRIKSKRPRICNAECLCCHKIWVAKSMRATIVAPNLNRSRWMRQKIDAINNDERSTVDPNVSRVTNYGRQILYELEIVLRIVTLLHDECLG